MPKGTPVIIIDIEKHKTTQFRTIGEAAKAVGCSRQLLMDTLETPDGLIPRTRPPLYIDATYTEKDVYDD